VASTLKAGVGAGVILVAAALALVPAGYVGWEAFTDEDGLTLAHLTDAYGTDLLGDMAWNSVWFAAGTALIAVPLGTALAFLVVRTDIPFRRTIFALAVLPLLVPGVVSTIGWILVASPRTGLVNAILGSGTVDIFSPLGMVVVEAAQSLPLVFLLMAGAFALADATLEEAAAVSGARPLSVLRRVTLPLAAPAAAASALIVSVRTLEAFEVPALLGLPDGIWVLTSRIWRALERLPADYGEAGAYALGLIVVIALGVWLYWRIAPRGGAIIGGGRPRRLALGRWRRPLGAFGLASVIVLVALPLAMVVYTSLQPRFAAPTLDGLTRLGLDAYGTVAGDPASFDALLNSLVLAAASATVATALTLFAAWLAVRSRLRGRGAIDFVVSLPLAIPGLVLGTALLFLYLRSPLPIYGTLWILLIAYVTQALPYGMRFGAAALAQVGAELEEAAQMSGADRWQRARRVLLPLVLPGLVAGWVYLAISAMRDLAASVVISGPGTRVVAVRIFEQYESGQMPEMAALAVIELGIVATLAVGGIVALRRMAPRLSRLGAIT
jgi:iron(III) transport system permease protein